MKKQTVIISLMVAALSVESAEEKNLKSRFELTREIDGTFAGGQRGRLVVAGDLFGQSRDFPNDLRIIASDGTQWPFFLHLPKETAETKTLSPEILNRSWVAGSEPYLQFDLVVPSTDGPARIHNRLELVTSGRDYVRRVEIFSGVPKESNGHMATGYLIDFSRQRNARNRTLRYPASDARRLHVRIYSNAQSADETFDLSSARLHYRAVVKVERETVGFIEMEVSEREQEKDAATWILDVGNRDRPVEFITFDSANKSYARCVSVYGRNTVREPWRWVGGGAIHVLADDRETQIKLHATDRFLKVYVFHYDDPPLAIDSIHLEAVPRYLVFEAATAGRAELCFRAWDIKAPRYDFKGRIDPETLSGLPIFQTLDAAENQAAKKQPWRKYSKHLGILAVGGVSLLVLWIIASMFRQQRMVADE